MEHRSMTQSPHQDKGISKILGYGEGLGTPLQGLGRITQGPQRCGEPRKASHSGPLEVGAIAGLSLSGFPESSPLFVLLAAQGELAKNAESDPQQSVRVHLSGRVLHSLSEHEILLSQFTRPV